jgi:hypothetical protein
MPEMMSIAITKVQWCFCCYNTLFMVFFVSYHPRHCCPPCHCEDKVRSNPGIVMMQRGFSLDCRAATRLAMTGWAAMTKWGFSLDCFGLCPRNDEGAQGGVAGVSPAEGEAEARRRRLERGETSPARLIFNKERRGFSGLLHCYAVRNDEAGFLDCFGRCPRNDEVGQ